MPPGGRQTKKREEQKKDPRCPSRRRQSAKRIFGILKQVKLHYSRFRNHNSQHLTMLLYRCLHKLMLFQHRLSSHNNFKILSQLFLSVPFDDDWYKYLKISTLKNAENCHLMGIFDTYNYVFALMFSCLYLVKLQQKSIFTKFFSNN